MTPQVTPTLLQRATSNPSLLQPHEMLSVQRTLGNQATARLLDGSRNSGSAGQPLSGSRGIIQGKSQVRPANDRYEQEADRITNTVMRQVRQPSNSEIAPQEQSAPAKGMDSGGQIARTSDKIDAKGADKIDTKSIQRSVGDPSGRAGGTLDKETEGRLQRAQSGGSALPDTIRRTLEPKLGADLSTVRIHTGNESADLNRKMGAKAFTHQNHIFYGAGQSPSDLSLTTHEAVHTMQQGAVQRTPQRPGQSPNQGGSGQPDARATNGQQIQRTIYNAKADAYYSNVLPGQRITQNNAVITATAYNNLGGGHSAIYVERLTKGDNPQRDDLKIHLLYDTRLNHTLIKFQHGFTPREPKKRSWVKSATDAENLIDRAVEIWRQPQSKKKYKFFGGSLTRGGMNCAKFAERILKAGGIKASSGIIFKTPNKLVKGENMGHEDTLEHDISENQKKVKEDQKKKGNLNVGNDFFDKLLEKKEKREKKQPTVEVDPQQENWVHTVYGKDFRLVKELPVTQCNREGHLRREHQPLPIGAHILVAEAGPNDGEILIQGEGFKNFVVKLAQLYEAAPKEDN